MRASSAAGLSPALRLDEVHAGAALSARYQLRQHGEDRRSAALARWWRAILPRPTRMTADEPARQAQGPGRCPGLAGAATSRSVWARPRPVSKVKWLFGADKARPCRNARPACLGMPADRAGRSDQDRSLRDGPGPRSIDSAWPGARSGPTDESGGRGRNGAPPNDRTRRRPIVRCCPRYIGIILQVPPLFFGRQDRRSMRSLRSGARRRALSTFRRAVVEIDRLELLSAAPTATAAFELECGKGTYVRSLARDLGP